MVQCSVPEIQLIISALFTVILGTSYWDQVTAHAVLQESGLVTRLFVKVSSQHWTEKIMQIFDFGFILLFSRFLVIHCPEATAPRHGFVYAPCDTPFRSECFVGCKRGYFIEGSARISCNSSGAWQPDNISCTSKLYYSRSFSMVKEGHPWYSFASVETGSDWNTE